MKVIKLKKCSVISVLSFAAMMLSIATNEVRAVPMQDVPPNAILPPPPPPPRAPLSIKVEAPAPILSKAMLEKMKNSYDCGESKLTSAKFMEMIKIIARHGDLTDVPFIEKTLGLKFASSPSILGDGSVQKGRTMYDADSLSGMPLKTWMNVSLNPDESGKNHPEVMLDFDSGVAHSANFRMCLHLSTAEFDSYFPEKPMLSGLMHHSTERMSGNFNLKQDNSGSPNITVGYTFDTKDGMISDVGLSQRP